jgi:hypothetical protein
LQGAYGQVTYYKNALGVQVVGSESALGNSVCSSVLVVEEQFQVLMVFVALATVYVQVWAVL